ncbi:MAG: dicarboxylate/amino acid:cation symporter [Niameybacter sp.]|uniref:dicarboxylate/amino acid:cation symporter n=1 Tax=Niameybacter sp. TaxID=2033640 RepID=UPI002FC78218
MGKEKQTKKVNEAQNTKQEKKKLGLTTKIFIGLLLGALTGVILHYIVPSGFVKDTVIINGICYVVGNGFLRAMQMLVVPLVFCSLVCGAMAIGDSKKLGKVGVKTILFYLVTTAIAITIALGTAKIINPGIGLDMSALEIAETTIAEKQSFADVLLNIIPKNPIQALAEGNMLPIIVFAILVGIVLAKQGDRCETVGNFFNEFNNVMMDMTMLVMKLAPIGVFCLIAKTFAGIGFSAFVPLLKYMSGVFIALGIQCFVVYMAFLKGFTGLNPFKFIKKFLPVMGFAFSTATSNATIPLSIDTLDKKMGVSKRISSFTIPLGATINMDGTAIMQGVAVIFAAQAFNITLTPADYITVIATATLASIGTAGVPGVGLITLSMVFASVGLPVEAIGMIMGIDRILDMTRTVVNITGDAVCTTIVAHQDKALNKEVFAAQELTL